MRAVLNRQRWREPFAIRSWLARKISESTDHRIGAKFPRHAPVITAREMLAPTVFAGLFKFAFVRNPWDRLVSAYAHFQREYPRELSLGGVATFEQFVTYLLESPAEQSARGTLVRALQRPQRENRATPHASSTRLPLWMD